MSALHAEALPRRQEAVTGGARSRFHRGRLAFRRWRRTRPFWAGLWTILSGLLIGGLPLGALQLAIFSSAPVWAGVINGALLVVFGTFMWGQPMLRFLLGVLTMILALTSFITSNLGGLFVGLLLGLVGGALSLSWVAPPAHPDEGGDHPAPA